MSNDRREFLGQLAAGAGLLGAMPASLLAMGRAFDGADASTSAESWDLSWTKKLTGTHKCVFDIPEVESGYGVWRATLWTNQYHEVLKIPAAQLSPVLVLRHSGVALAMTQAFWDKYDLGKAKEVKHPITEKPTNRNPVLLNSSRAEDELPPMFDGVMLDKFLARGGVALACNVALQDVAGIVAKVDSVGEEDAYKRAVAGLVPGVILQPSGVFAAVRAQDAGCRYLRAS